MTKCKKCGHVWNPQVENPKTCPNCKQYNWQEKKENIKVKTVKCKLCKHKWVPRKPIDEIVACPNCIRRGWR